MNVKNHRLYSDKFKLSVVDLSQIEMATEEDKAYHIDYWARLFKAKTWEDLRMLAEKNEFLQEAAQSVYIANADEMVRQKCRAREEAERHKRTMKRNMDLLKQENVALKNDKVKLQGDNIKLQDNINVLQKEAAYNTVQSIENLMQNLNLSLEEACKALGKIVEEYQNAKQVLETK